MAALTKVAIVVGLLLVTAQSLNIPMDFYCRLSVELGMTQAILMVDKDALRGVIFRFDKLNCIFTVATSKTDACFDWFFPLRQRELICLVFNEAYAKTQRWVQLLRHSHYEKPDAGFGSCWNVHRRVCPLEAFSNQIVFERGTVCFTVKAINWVLLGLNPWQKSEFWP